MSDLPAATSPVFDGLRAMLEAVVGATLVGRDPAAELVGDHGAPPPPSGATVPPLPYAAAYVIDTPGEEGPPFGALHSDGSVVVQITSVGATRAQAAMLADRNREAILGRSAGGYTNAIDAGPRQAVIGRDLVTAAQPDQNGRLWSQPDRFRLWVTPS